MTRIAIFDVDNTLTESRSALSAKLSSALTELSRYMPVAFISGGSFEDMNEQVISRLSGALMDNVYALPTEGAELRCYDGAWRSIYAYDIADAVRKRIFEEISRISGISPDRLGEYVEDRGRVIAYHALGTRAPIEAKYAWDPDGAKRRKLVKGFLDKLSGTNAFYAGSTTINFTEAGIDKSFGISRLLSWIGLSPADALFVGDSFGEHGNDSPVITMGVGVAKTSGPGETLGIVNKLLAEAKDPRTAPLAPKRVAYLCMEYALEDDLPLFAGGLGILAADIVRAAGRRKDIELHAVGLINRKGMKRPDRPPETRDYSKDLADRGYEIASKDGSPVLVEIPFEKRVIKARAWTKQFGASKLYLLDTDVDGNLDRDKRITDYLYDIDFPTRIAAEMTLGIGGYRMLQALGVETDTYHLNEGHTGFGALAAALEGRRVAGGVREPATKRFARVRDQIVATKHTILSGSGTYLTRSDFERYVGKYISSQGADVEDVFNYGRLERDENMFSTTKLLISSAGRSSGVSEAHVRAEKIRYPSSPLISIANGVDSFRWTAPQISRIYGSAGGSISDAKATLRRELVTWVNQTTGSSLDPDVLTVVWARRFVAYKRPRLLLNDRDRLLGLISSSTPIQFVFSGSAYMGDEDGQKAIREIESIASDPRAMGRVARMPEYSVRTAERLVRCADIWLNTPIPGYEACGTSGMKAGQNGSLVMSTLDGWVTEVPELEGVGWLMDEEGIASRIYDMLSIVAREFYTPGASPGASERWTARMTSTRTLATTRFDIQRMLAEYIEKLYSEKQ